MGTEALAFEAIRERFGSGVCSDLETYAVLIVKWQKAQNLVSRETLGSLWERHFCDSARLFPIVNTPTVWIDLGSGAGLPALVTAILQKHTFPNGDHHVHLVESNGRKVAFLRAVIRDLSLNATVHSCRIEDFDEWNAIDPDCISARALSSLQNLLTFVEPSLTEKTRLLFHKGRDINGEIAEASNSFDFEVVKYEQDFAEGLESDGLILEVKSVKSKSSNV